MHFSRVETLGTQEREARLIKDSQFSTYEGYGAAMVMILCRSIERQALSIGLFRF